MARLVGLIALLFLALPATAQDRKEVDLALVLAIDISGSIDPDEARLQRQGYVEAFKDPVIVQFHFIVADRLARLARHTGTRPAERSRPRPRVTGRRPMARAL